VSRKDVQNAALDWAESTSPVSDDSPWAKFDYLRLRETLEEIVATMEAAMQPMVSPPSEQEPDNTLQLVVSNDPETAVDHSGAGTEKPVA
jgi:hypothetical protein